MHPFGFSLMVIVLLNLSVSFKAALLQADDSQTSSQSYGLKLYEDLKARLPLIEEVPSIAKETLPAVSQRFNILEKESPSGLKEWIGDVFTFRLSDTVDEWFHHVFPRPLKKIVGEGLIVRQLKLLGDHLSVDLIFTKMNSEEEVKLAIIRSGSGMEIGGKRIFSDEFEAARNSWTLRHFEKMDREQFNKEMNQVLTQFEVSKSYDDTCAAVEAVEGLVFAFAPFGVTNGTRYGGTKNQESLQQGKGLDLLKQFRDSNGNKQFIAMSDALKVDFKHLLPGELPRPTTMIKKSVVFSEAQMNLIKITPPNELVMLMYRVEGKVTGVYGRVEKVFSDSDGILALKVTSVESHISRVIPADRIVFENSFLTKVFTANEQAQTLAKLHEAIEAGKPVSYMDHPYATRPREITGWVQFAKPPVRETEDLRITLSTGLEMSVRSADIDPASIRIINVIPKPLNATQTILEEALRGAMIRQTQVSFIETSTGQSSGVKFEGRVTGTELSAEGEWLVLVERPSALNRRGDESSVDSFKFPLSKIEVETVQVLEPVIKGGGEGSRGGGELPFRLTAFQGTMLNHSTQVTLPDFLLSEIFSYSNLARASEPTQLPKLGQCIMPGQELRVYFRKGDIQVRLTIRRNESGEWSFGDTGWDRIYVNENSGYFTNELNALNDSYHQSKPPAQRLGWSLQVIYHSMLKQVILEQYRGLMERWVKVIPEDIRTSFVAELILRDQGKVFSLERGVEAAGSAPLSEIQMKTLAAIRYLEENNLVFYSSNARASSVELGIYPQTGAGSVTVKRLHMAGYDFESQLTSAMQAKGLEYRDGEWRQK